MNSAGRRGYTSPTNKIFGYSKNPMRRFLPVTLFAAAFAYAEAAVVVYLRLLYYPDGFQFPLILLPENVGLVELGREAATILMLAAAGVLAGDTPRKRFYFAVYAFGLWDLFYYVWLWVLLGWPPSLFTFDVLFLIPVIWVGPVLAPLVVAVSLCAGALTAVRLEERGKAVTFRPLDHLLLWGGAAAIVLSFTWDFQSILGGHPPGRYRWEWFCAGEVSGLIALARIFRRASKNREAALPGGE